MSLAQALSSYFTLNLLVILGFTSLSLLFLVLRGLKKPMKSQTELELHYAVLGLILILTLASPFIPQQEFFKPAAKIWSAPSLKSFSQDYTAGDGGGYLALPTPSGFSSLEADKVAQIWLMLALILAVSGAFIIGRDLRNLLRIKRKSFLIKQRGQVRIYLNDESIVPFSYWLPGQTNVVIPTGLLGKRADYKMVLAHELQHHRHGDTKWIYVMWAVKLICVINPAIYFWNKWISEVQEFACDETLVDQGKVTSQAYARCLVEVAQTAVNQRDVPVCATGLVFLVERNMLKRRIEKMLTTRQTKTGRSIGLSFGIALATLMAATAFASKGLVQDRRVTLEQAQDMAKVVKSQSNFPVVVNDQVLKQLNKYIGTPEGRDFMRTALQRMENYRAVIEPKLQQYHAPPELMAVPVVESGYQNLEQGTNQMWGAGIWMFIASTARTYGLRVDDKVDERLNANLLTDAAMRYLTANNLRFKDWSLALMAYNVGENRVQKGIEKTGSRDAWELIRQGYEGDQDYLARVMATILILRNPQSLH